MSIPQVDINSFTIATQVETINEIAQLEGDLETLETDAKDNLVAAINEIRSSLAGLKRAILTYAIAMS
jgi:hypothetical protein